MPVRQQRAEQRYPAKADGLPVRESRVCVRQIDVVAAVFFGVRVGASACQIRRIAVRRVCRIAFLMVRLDGAGLRDHRMFLQNVGRCCFPLPATGNRRYYSRLAVLRASLVLSQLRHYFRSHWPQIPETP